MPVHTDPEAKVRYYLDGNDFYRYVRATCARCLPTQPLEVEDAAMEVLGKAWRARFTFKPTPTPQAETHWRAAFRKWIAQIARNHCLDVLRRRHELLAEDFTLPEPTTNPFAGFTDNLALRGCLERLEQAAPDAHEVVIARYVEGYTWKDFREAMALTVSEARTLSQTALRQLQRCLSQNVADPTYSTLERKD